jgi:hypothetical protein
MNYLTGLLLSQAQFHQFLAQHTDVLSAEFFKLNNSECTICREATLGDSKTDTTIIKITDCSHIFHRMCITEWLETDEGAKTCPICRDALFDKPDRVAAAFASMNDACADAMEQEYWQETDAVWEAELAEEQAEYEAELRSAEENDENDKDEEESSDSESHRDIVALDDEDNDDVEDLGDGSEATVDVNVSNRKTENVDAEDDETDLEE